MKERIINQNIEQSEKVLIVVSFIFEKGLGLIFDKLKKFHNPSNITIITSNYLKRILCYETPSETEFGYPGKHIFNPNYYVSLSKKNIDDKIKALKIYKSQIKKFPHPRSGNGLKILSSYRGIQSSSNYSEAFIIIRAYE